MKVKWSIGDRAIVEDDNICCSAIIWGVSTEPQRETEKHFGIVLVEDVRDESDNILFGQGDTLNVEFSMLKKPMEYYPNHIATRFCWCCPVLNYEDKATDVQVWEHNYLQ